MKFLKILFVLFVLISITSCSSDDEVIQYDFNNANLSSGSFDLNYLSSYTTATVDINGLEIISEFSATGETFQFTVTFFENGTYIADGQYVVIETTRVAGQITEEDTYIEDVDNEEGTYVTNDGTMQLVMDGDIFDVTLFNANELRLVQNDTYTEDGVDFVVTGELRMIR
ncbi:MAG: hypothetical protein P8P27_07020 [Flavobacteriaceae bacterium]|nr:hypothetical protein [Flavobacteriaceae bacterium]